MFEGTRAKVGPARDFHFNASRESVAGSIYAATVEKRRFQ